MVMTKQVGWWLGQGELILLPSIEVGQLLMRLGKLGRGSIWVAWPSSWTRDYVACHVAELVIVA